MPCDSKTSCDSACPIHFCFSPISCQLPLPHFSCPIIQIILLPTLQSSSTHAANCPFSIFRLYPIPYNSPQQPYPIYCFCASFSRETFHVSETQPDRQGPLAQQVEKVCKEEPQPQRGSSQKWGKASSGHHSGCPRLQHRIRETQEESIGFTR